MSDLISIGIVLYEEITLFEKQIKSLLNETSKYPVKEFLFILTSPKTDIHKKFEQIFKSHFENYRFWIFTENHIGKARSILVNECQTKLLYMIDPDIEIPDQSLNQLFSQTHLIEKDICGLAGEAYLKSSDNTLDRFFNSIQTLNRYFKNNNQMLTYRKNQKIQHAPTCHLLLDVQKIKALGNFSDKYSTAGEDLDLSHRLADNGLKYLFIQNSQVIHLQNLTVSMWYQKIFRYGTAQAVCWNNNGFQQFMIHKYILFLFGLIAMTALILFPLKTISIVGLILLVSFLFFRNVFIMILSLVIYIMGISFGLFLRKKTT